MPITILGNWNASANIPTLVNGNANTAGDTYVVSVAGTQNLGSGTAFYALNSLVTFESGVWTGGGTVTNNTFTTGVTSVALAAPSWYNITGSPITTAGTITITPNPALPGNQVLGTPNGGGPLSLRSFSSTDLPDITGVAGTYTNPTVTINTKGLVTAISTGSGSGGSGIVNPMTSIGDLIRGAASGNPVRLPIGSTGQVLSVVGGIPTWATVAGTGTVTSISAGTGLVTTPGPITSTGTIALDDTAVTPGSYTNTSITVDAQGRITAASSGSGGGTVTSIDISGGTTGLTASGGPITTSGTITLAGTLALANGGTGASLTAVAGGIVFSNATTFGILNYPGGTGRMLLSNTPNPNWSAATIPFSGGAVSDKLLYTDGTNYVFSVPTFPVSASSTARKILVSDGTNWVASTETYAVPGTSGNVLTSDGTNWISSAPATSGTVTSVSGTANQITSTGGTTPVLALASAGTLPGAWALGTPASVTLTNGTGLPIGGISATGTPSATTFLRGDGTWNTPAASGANTALSNLASVAINTTLLPGADNTIALGNTSFQWSDLFLGSGSIINWDNGDVTCTHSANYLTWGGLTNFDIGTTAAFTTGTIELGASSDTTISRSSAGAIAVEGVVLPSISSTNTLTNKRITKRTGTTTTSATPTINTDNVDFYSITAQSGNITSMTTNLSGTPTEGQTLWIALTATSGTPTVTWGASFEDSTVTAPTALSTTRIDAGFVWNTVTSKWRCIAKA